MQYKIGDRIIHNSFGTGTVINIFSGDLLIEFDFPMGGHDGLGTGKSGHCWFCVPKELFPYDKRFIIFYLKGR